MSTNQTYEKARELKRGIELTSSAHQPNANADTRSGLPLLYVHRGHIDYSGRGAQGGHFDFHTVPEPCSSMLLYVHRGHNYRLLEMGSPERPPRLPHSS